MSAWRAFRLWLSMEQCIRVHCPKCGMTSQPVDYRVAGWMQRSHICTFGGTSRVRWPRQRLKGILRVGDGDTLIVHIDQQISQEQAAMVKALFNDAGIKVVVTSPPLQIIAVQEGPNADR